MITKQVTEITTDDDEPAVNPHHCTMSPVSAIRALSSSRFTLSMSEVL